MPAPAGTQHWALTVHVKDSSEYRTHVLRASRSLAEAGRAPLLGKSPVNAFEEASLLASDPCGFLQVQIDIQGGRSSVGVDHHLTNATCSIQRGPEQLQVHLRLIRASRGLGRVLKQHKKLTHKHTHRMGKEDESGDPKRTLHLGPI